jgi:hypothetical protein
MREFREELGRDGHAIVEAFAIARLPLECMRAVALAKVHAEYGLVRPNVRFACESFERNWDAMVMQ